MCVRVAASNRRCAPVVVAGAAELSQEKSKLGLAEEYEKDYKEQARHAHTPRALAARTHARTHTHTR